MLGRGERAVAPDPQTVVGLPSRPSPGDSVLEQSGAGVPHGCEIVNLGRCHQILERCLVPAVVCSEQIVDEPVWERLAQTRPLTRSRGVSRLPGGRRRVGRTGGRRDADRDNEGQGSHCLS
jgi:hypothetical protein